MAFNIHSIYAAVTPHFRKKRLEKFQAFLAPRPGDRLLDVGGIPANWTCHPPLVGRLDILNLYPLNFDPAAHPDHPIRTLVGDGRCLPADDASYEIVFSNSVIEHLGSLEDQRRFADEVSRVGRGLWIQTPAREFWFEPHYLAPGLHWLPRNLRGRLLRHFTPWGWLQKPSPREVQRMLDSIRLLSRKEMQTLFPDCRIYTERLGGLFPKSHVAWRPIDRVGG